MKKIAIKAVYFKKPSNIKVFGAKKIVAGENLNFRGLRNFISRFRKTTGFPSTSKSMILTDFLV